MADTFDGAFAEVQPLVSTFGDKKDYYLSAQYQEQEARQDFIDKFWKALGWDVTHETQRNPYAQEVKVERGVTMAEGRKRADYSFALAPDFETVRFFVEAKKPSREIRNSQDYFQTIRYGWNRQTPLAVLMDFEQFHVLDCRARPDIGTALDAAVKQYRYTDYADPAKFAEIYWLFSREAVADRSLEKYVTDHLKRAPGRGGQRRLDLGGFIGIDESFLRDLDDYRGQLARAFHAANPNLDSETLTECTQRVLDRLVFLRFLEDKLIEPTPMVSGFVHKPSAWAAFLAERPRLDRVYNGNIFKEHLIDRKTFHAPADAVFSDICDQLASDNSPYLFNEIPIHILGSIYERFLGNVIVVDGADAKVDQKPEVRKAGGVYYTPDYIVRYIVENTVGKQIAGKTPAEIAGLRFADIACGSGSFLLGVYDTLLRYHTDFYNAKTRGRAAEARKAACLQEDGVFRLSLLQKRDILLANIWGVDIDAQAVEVAQLSLYLKLLEEETTASAHDQQVLSGALLPTLTDNIVCGNSLVGWDMFADEDEEVRYNPLDFSSAFPLIMKNGGFDAVVGNPPYIRIQTLQEVMPAVLGYLREHYLTAKKGNYDLYVVFVERALQLLKATGQMGYIVPHKFFNAQYGAALRQLIAQGRNLSEIVHFGHEQIFTGATTYTSLLFLNKSRTEKFHLVRVDNLDQWRAGKPAAESTIPNESVPEGNWNFVIGPNQALMEKLRETLPRPLTIPLEDVTIRIFQGIKTSADKVYILDERERRNGLVRVFSRQTESEYWLEPNLLHPLIKGGDSKRYLLSQTNRVILFPYASDAGTAHLITIASFEKRYPATWKYLEDNKNYLEEREHGKMRGDQWYGYGRVQALDVMPLPKIFTPDIAPHSAYSLDETGEAFFTGGVSGGYGILPKPPYSSEYLLGLLNSQLLEWYIHQTATQMRGGWFSYESRFIRSLPIRQIAFDVPEEKTLHDTLCQLVRQMIPARRQWADAVTDQNKALYERKCASIDARIEAMIARLYELTDEHIELIKASHYDIPKITPNQSGGLDPKRLLDAVRKASGLQ